MSRITPDILALGVTFPAWSPLLDAPRSALAAEAGAGPKTDTQPIAEPGDGRVGHAAPMWGVDMLWERVHIVPREIDMGFVLAQRTDEVIVWNAYRSEARDLEAVDHEGAEGVQIVAGSLPVTIEPYKDHIVTLITSLVGPPNLRATLTYRFDDGAEPVQRLTATRTLAFAFRPRTGVREVLEWLTDVQEAYAGAEQRAQVRIAPRQSFVCEHWEDDPDAMAALKAVLTGWQRRYFGLPVWAEARTIGPVSADAEWIAFDTAHADYKDGGFLMLRGADWTAAEIVQILEVLPDGCTLALPVIADFPGRTTVMPVRIARVSGELSLEEHALHNRHVVTFAVEDNDPIAAGPSEVQYKGLDTLLSPYKISAHVARREIVRPSEVIDGKTGRVLVDPHRDWGRVLTAEVRFAARGRAAAWSLRQWLHRRAGRLRALWVPTFAADLRLIEPFGAGDTILIVANHRYSDMLFSNPQFRHIALFRHTGEILLREILSAQVVSNAAEWLTIDSALGFAGSMDDFERISFLALNRLSGDRVEIHWQRAGVCAAAVGLTGLDHAPEVN